MAHSSLKNHRKTTRLMRILGLSRPHVIGLLECFWQCCYEDLSLDAGGLLVGWTDHDIAGAALFDGEPETLVNAFADAGFLDRNCEGYSVHDYGDRAPHYVQQRWKNRIARQKTPIVANSFKQLQTDLNCLQVPNPTHGMATQGKKNIGTKKSVKKKARKPREPDPIWDTIVAGWFSANLSDNDRTRIGKLVKLFKQKAIDADEIPVRRERYNRIGFVQGQRPDPCTPEALLKHWDRFGPDADGPTPETNPMLVIEETEP